MKITSNVYMVGGQSLSHPSDASIFLVVSGEAAALVDSGTGAGHDRVMENIRSVVSGPPAVQYCFITHCHYDHSGGANALRRATGCRVVAHEQGRWFLESGDSETTAASWYGAVMAPTAVDIAVEGKERTFDIGGLTLTFRHAPGHSPDSSVLTAVSDGRLVLFGQDVHGPLHDSLKSSRGDYEESLLFLLSLDADILCEGHFGVYIGREKVRAYISSFLE